MLSLPSLDNRSNSDRAFPTWWSKRPFVNKFLGDHSRAHSCVTKKMLKREGQTQIIEHVFRPARESCWFQLGVVWTAI